MNVGSDAMPVVEVHQHPIVWFRNVLWCAFPITQIASAYLSSNSPQLKNLRHSGCNWPRIGYDRHPLSLHVPVLPSGLLTAVVAFARAPRSRKRHVTSRVVVAEIAGRPMFLRSLRKSRDFRYEFWGAHWRTCESIGNRARKSLPRR